MWIPQIPGYLDAMTAIAIIGQVTERIEIGTAVIPIQTRHPIPMAQQALTTQVACGGRFTLGLGPSHHWIVEGQLGLPYERPAHLVRNYLEVLNQAFAGPGPVDVENDGYRVHSPMDVADAIEMPILISTLAPVMLRIAGEHTSGTILWMADERADRRPRGPAHHEGRGRRRAGRRRGSWPACRSRCAPTATSTPLARTRVRCWGTPTSRRTTWRCSSTATPKTSATPWPRGASLPSSNGCAVTATPASPTSPPAWSRSVTTPPARVESRQRTQAFLATLCPEL